MKLALSTAAMQVLGVGSPGSLSCCGGLRCSLGESWRRMGLWRPAATSALQATMATAALLVAVASGSVLAAEKPTGDVWAKIAPFFKPPAEYANDFGTYRSPLVLADGRPVKTADQWQRRREEIRKFWFDSIGHWPPLIEKPAMEILELSLIHI